MRDKCARCGKRRGNRHCPALCGPICSRCCGEYRLLRIACPPTCPHLEQHEAFQRDKQEARYQEAWLQVNADLRDREADLKLILVLERLLKEAVEQVGESSDAEVASALADLLRRLSPIEIVTPASSPLSRLLWEGLTPQLQAGKLSRERVKEGITRLAKVAEALRDQDAPRAFLQGLFAHVEKIFPEEDQREKAQTGLILTPDELRRSL